MKNTPLTEKHIALGAKMAEFAGYNMPISYAGIREEHETVRTATGVFDVSHMGVFQAEGPHAALFLDCVCGNDINALPVGESCSPV